MENNLINYNKFVSSTNIEGPGNRFAIWLQGCVINCFGCSNQEMIPLIKKTVRPVSELFKAIVDAKERFNIEGITVLGGEPLIQPKALEELLFLCKSIGLTTIVFSGYLYENIKEKYPKIIESLDILIDGPFMINKLDKSRRLVGSTNQRIWKLSDVYENNPYFEQSTIEGEFSIEDNVVSINGDGAHLYPENNNLIKMWEEHKKNNKK